MYKRQGLYPTDNAKFNDLRDALEKLQLNDAALTFEPESSQALGFGFRCGFLGMLHMDVIQERLEREFDLDLITTAPSVTYHVNLHDGSTKNVENPAEMPDVTEIKSIEEPFVKASIMVPNDYVGAVMELCQRLSLIHILPTSRLADLCQALRGGSCLRGLSGRQFGSGPHPSSGNRPAT